MPKFKKIIVVSGGVIALCFLLIILLISPIAKWLVEKYDVQFTGREITLARAYVNPMTGYIHFTDVKIQEFESDSTFLSVKGLTINFSMLKLITGKYEISQIILDEPKGYAIYNDSISNFEDVIQRFKGDTLDSKIHGAVYFSLLNIVIKSGEFYYTEVQTPINYFIKNVNIESAGFEYEVDTMSISFAFSSGMGTGDIAGNMNINLKNLDYGLNFEIQRFNMEIINQYLKDITEYGTFSAILDAKLQSSGNFDSYDSISTNGHVEVSDFHFGKSENEDFASFESLEISIKNLSPKELIYQYDSVILNKPFFRYEMYDYLDNIQTMFGKDGQNLTEIKNNPNKFNLVIEIAKLIEQLSRNFFRSQYNAGKIAVYDANIQFSDYSLGELFSIGLYPFSAVADSVDKRKDKIDLLVTSAIEPFGKAYVHLDVNPKDSTSFNMNYHFKDIALTTFNPYVLNYTSFPLDRGTLELQGRWKVREGNISSDNHVLLIDPRTGKKVKSRNNKWIPVPLALAFVRESGNVVDYNIPISGNLKDPQFHLKDVIIDLLKNIFIKPVTTPYRLEVKSIEQKLEQSFNITWPIDGSNILPVQEKFIKEIASFLKENPDAIILIEPQYFTQKEKEFILLFEAKKEYINTRSRGGLKLFKSDSTYIARMSIKDEGFVKYLNEKTNDPLLFTTYHKAAKLIDASLVNRKFDELKAARKQAIFQIFKEESVESQIKILDGITTIPYNGFSFYSISYKDQFPEYITKAFERMNDLNDQPLREKYKSNRHKSNPGKE